MLLGLLIAVQNLPEGFNAYREMLPREQAAHYELIIIFVLMALLAPCLAC